MSLILRQYFLLIVRYALFVFFASTLAGVAQMATYSSTAVSTISTTTASAQAQVPSEIDCVSDQIKVCTDLNGNCSPTQYPQNWVAGPNADVINTCKVVALDRDSQFVSQGFYLKRRSAPGCWQNNQYQRGTACSTEIQANSVGSVGGTVNNVSCMGPDFNMLVTSQCSITSSTPANQLATCLGQSGQLANYSFSRYFQGSGSVVKGFEFGGLQQSSNTIKAFVTNPADQPFANGDTYFSAFPTADINQGGNNYSSHYCLNGSTYRGIQFTKFKRASVQGAGPTGYSYFAGDAATINSLSSRIFEFTTGHSNSLNSIDNVVLSQNLSENPPIQYTVCNGVNPNTSPQQSVTFSPKTVFVGRAWATQRGCTVCPSWPSVPCQGPQYCRNQVASYVRLLLEPALFHFNPIPPLTAPHFASGFANYAVWTDVNRFPPFQIDCKTNAPGHNRRYASTNNPPPDDQLTLVTAFIIAY